MAGNLDSKILYFFNPKHSLMHFPNKPHFKIFSSATLLLVQYLLLSIEFRVTANQDQNKMFNIALLTTNAIVSAGVIGSTASEIKDQINSKISNEIRYLSHELQSAEKAIEQAVLDEASFLLGSKVYNPSHLIKDLE